MIIEKTGDMLTTDAFVVCQQVNCMGVMGAGLAKQIRTRYPEVFTWYSLWCNDKSLRPGLLGNIQLVYVDNITRVVVNMYAQYNFGRVDGHCYTDYNAFMACLLKLRSQFPNTRIAIPDHIGCGLAGGDWEVVRSMIEEVFGNTENTVEIWKLAS